jgi:mRNA interferase RelE/StbE
MKVFFKPSFLKDFKKLPQETQEKVYFLCVEEFSRVSDFSLLRQYELKHLTGFKGYYRIRIGNYRVGFKKNEKGEIEFMRVLHRKDIYKHFP